MKLITIRVFEDYAIVENEKYKNTYINPQHIVHIEGYQKTRLITDADNTAKKFKMDNETFHRFTLSDGTIIEDIYDWTEVDYVAWEHKSSTKGIFYKPKDIDEEGNILSESSAPWQERVSNNNPLH